MYNYCLTGLDGPAVKFQGKKKHWFTIRGGGKKKKNLYSCFFCCSASVHDPRLLFRNLVGCVGPEDGSWTWVRPLLEQRPRRCGVCPRLCLVTLGQTTWPRAPVDKKCLNELELRTSTTTYRYSGSPESLLAYFNMSACSTAVLS